MISVGKNELICDLAETYGVLDYKALQVELLATLSVGLRDNSRIKMKISGIEIQPDILLLASTVDALSLILWTKTKDGEKGINRPKSIVEVLQKKERDKQIITFDTAEEFEAEKARIIGEVK